jgi:hypothetical protein
MSNNGSYNDRSKQQSLSLQQRLSSTSVKHSSDYATSAGGNSTSGGGAAQSQVSSNSSSNNARFDDSARIVKITNLPSRSQSNEIINILIINAFNAIISTLTHLTQF